VQPWTSIAFWTLLLVVQLGKLFALQAPLLGPNLAQRCGRCFATADSDASPAPMKAAILIIGNEILSGSVADTNTPWLAKLLFK